MSQGAVVIADDDGGAVLAALNAAFARLNTTASGGSRPADAAAGTLWLDTNTPSATVWTLYLYDGSSDISLGTFDSTAHTFSAVTVTQAQADNSTKEASTAYADRIGVQQVVSTITGAVATGTTPVPFDDTIPQNTEGDQYMSLSITPKSATSKLVIQVTANFGISALAGIILSLFQDSTANALATVWEFETTPSGRKSVTLTYVMTSGTTSATTFKVRAGPDGAATLTFNGNGGSRLMGGVFASSIVIMEVGV